MIRCKLHDLLWQKQVTQKALARGIKVAESTISGLAHGADCKLSTIDKICKYLQCKISDVIEFEND